MKEKLKKLFCRESYVMFYYFMGGLFLALGLLKILVGDYLSAVSNGLFIIVLVQTAMIHKRAMFWRATVIKQYEVISVMIEKYQELSNSVQEKGAAKED